MIKKIYRKIKNIFFKNLYGTQNANNRNFWIEKILRDIPAGKTILDVGAGNTNKRIYCDHLNYISQDIAEYQGNELSEGYIPEMSIIQVLK